MQPRSLRGILIFSKSAWDVSTRKFGIWIPQDASLPALLRPAQHAAALTLLPADTIMKFGGPLAALVLSAAVGLCSATGFTNSFGAITSGSSVQLTWDDIAAEHFPLCITAQLIERSGEDGYGANAYRVNITSMYIYFFSLLLLFFFCFFLS